MKRTSRWRTLQTQSRVCDTPISAVSGLPLLISEVQSTASRSSFLHVPLLLYYIHRTPPCSRLDKVFVDVHAPCQRTRLQRGLFALRLEQPPMLDQRLRLPDLQQQIKCHETQKRISDGRLYQRVRKNRLSAESSVR
jgi:hypothetical protein